MRWSEVLECHERRGGSEGRGMRGGGKESGDEWTHKAGGEAN